MSKSKLNIDQKKYEEWSDQNTPAGSYKPEFPYSAYGFAGERVFNSPEMFTSAKKTGKSMYTIPNIFNARITHPGSG